MSSDTFLGRLGNREGINVAKVEVVWYTEEPTDPGFNSPIGISHTAVERGFYIVHAVGDEPEIAEAGEFGTIYTIFEGLVEAAMQAKVDSGRIDSYEIDDISAI